MKTCTRFSDLTRSFGPERREDVERMKRELADEMREAEAKQHAQPAT